MYQVLLNLKSQKLLILDHILKYNLELNWDFNKNDFVRPQLITGYSDYRNVVIFFWILNLNKKLKLLNKITFKNFINNRSKFIRSLQLFLKQILCLFILSLYKIGLNVVLISVLMRHHFLTSDIKQYAKHF